MAHQREKQGIAEGIVEPVNDPAEGMEFYLPHRPVIREDAESTKIRIVMDGSARDRNDAPSLNECLETGPALQKKIWDILIRNRLKPVALTGDIQKAFLQILTAKELLKLCRYMRFDEEQLL